MRKLHRRVDRFAVRWQFAHLLQPLIALATGECVTACGASRNSVA